jgi:hypothetical protein
MMTTDAAQIAHEFLMDDLRIPEEDRDWFAVLISRPIGESWCVVEIGVEGLPDKWVLQVWDTGVCDPSYAFVSPIKAPTPDLDEFPEPVAQAIASERQAQSL